MAAELNQIKRIRNHYEKDWLSLDGVEGIGIGIIPERGKGIIISVSKAPEAYRRLIPDTIEGVPVHIQRTGPYRALE